MELENKCLNAEHFSKLLRGDSLGALDTDPGIFLLDQDFRLVYPAAAKDSMPLFAADQRSRNSGYSLHMNRAETEEFARNNYSFAVRNYQTALGLAATKQQEALAIEGMARSCMAGQKYPQAISYYQRLRNEYSQTVNSGGHPYGISAPLQLYAIGTITGEEVCKHDSLLAIYEQIRQGHWLISSSAYIFFKSEYASILGLELESQESGFERTLKFQQFLIGQLIPAIQERSGFSGFHNSTETKRMYLPANGDEYLISYKEIPLTGTDRQQMGGIRWNLDTVMASIIPPLLATAEEETGLEFLLVNGNRSNLPAGDADHIPETSLRLTFSKVPFPWTLVAIQPGYEKLDSDLKIQLVIYGLLIAIIIVLMLFGAFVLLRDISREADSMRLQTEFVHNVSHELKTPLSLIRLYGETLLLKEHLPEKDRKEGLQIISKESERLSQMINNILDFSKIEMGRKEFDLKPGNLAEVTRGTLESYRYHLVKKGFTIEEDLDPDIPILLFDRDAVEGILVNLFSNVIKFSDRHKRMGVKLKKTPEVVLLVVADQGIGIPPDELPHIFDRFYRVKGNSDFEARGSGLGLTLVKHAAEAHGWQIEVQSTPGKGSSFTIIIPYPVNLEEQL